MHFLNFVFGAILLSFPQFNLAAPNAKRTLCPAGSTDYIVKPGQTVTSITSYFHMTIPAFEALNPSITVINVIYAGQSVCVTSGTPPTPSTTCPYTYTLKDAQSAFSVAKYFGMTIAEFKAMNPSITSVSSLTAGEAVCVKSFCQAPFVEVTVKAGDTISGLVNYYGWTMAAFCAANPNVDVNAIITPGEHLCFNQNY